MPEVNLGPDLGPQPPTAKGVRNFGVLIGHTEKRPGAYSKHMHTSEYLYNSKLAKQIEIVCRNMPELRLNPIVQTRNPLPVETPSGPETPAGDNLEGAFQQILKKKPARILELHFNSFNGYASGSEVLFSDNYDKAGIKELALAQLLVKNISNTLGIPSRGVKEIAKEGERGFQNLRQTTSVPSVLLEPGFGDHPVDAKAMLEKGPQLASVIVLTVAAWLEQVGAV